MYQSLHELNRRPGATDAMIAESERKLGLKLPAEYVEFLKVSNGGEGFIGPNAYVMLWPVEELAERNRSYEVGDATPGLLIFGSNGGGEAYGFDIRTPHFPIVQVPFIVLSWDDALPVGGSFDEFLAQLSTS
jgi:hypothetical protein